MPPRATQKRFLLKSPKAIVPIAFWLKGFCLPCVVRPALKLCTSRPARWPGTSPAPSHSPAPISRSCPR